jgi:hypothetical protein
MIMRVHKKHNGTSKEINYQRGPRGGGMSMAVKPLMHWAAAPSPTFRTYCIIKENKISNKKSK